METRQCLVCNRELPIVDFRFNGRGYSKNCKECCNKKDKNYFVSAGYKYQEESYYLTQLKKVYPATWEFIIIRIRNGLY